MTARRKACGYSYSDVAAFVGVTESCVRSWEAGQSPRAIVLRKLCDYLFCTVDDLMPAVKA